MREGSTHVCEYQEAWLIMGPSLDTAYQDEESNLNRTESHYMQISKFFYRVQSIPNESPFPKQFQNHNLLIF